MPCFLFKSIKMRITMSVLLVSRSPLRKTPQAWSAICFRFTGTTHEAPVDTIRTRSQKAFFFVVNQGESRGLIEEKNLGPINQGASDGDALLFSAGELRWHVMQSITHTYGP
jgi:hypothetical protein